MLARLRLLVPAATSLLEISHGGDVDRIIERLDLRDERRTHLAARQFATSSLRARIEVEACTHSKNVVPLELSQIHSHNLVYEYD